MTPERLDLLKGKLNQFGAEYSDTNGSPGFYLQRNSLIEACRMLKNELGYNFLVDAVGVDRFTKKDRFEMIYNLVSIENNERIFLKVKLETKNPVMQSLSQVWESANWYEREAYDLVGINFENHPDLRRMYMPESYDYHPLRKDFPLMGIPDSIPLPNK
jgi:NADH-quinone oxidoreductase subunit C